MNTKIAAVFCAGGPAPGFNAVIHGLTGKLVEAGWSVIGLRDGLKYVMQGEHINEVLLATQTSMHCHRGGSFIGASRANPTKDPAKLQAVVDTLLVNGVSVLVSIGGDDTAKSARAIGVASGGRIQVIHVPKTIDNDLPVGHGVNTFGYITAVNKAIEVVSALKVDCDTTGDRHFVRVIMGRSAGWLALGTAYGTDSPVFIPEEFEKDSITIAQLADLVIAASLKAEACTLTDGSKWAKRGVVHVVAEGVFEKCSDFETVVKEMFAHQEDLVDEHGHLRFSRIHLQALLDTAITRRMSELGITQAIKGVRGSLSIIVDKLGFELRCIDPVPRDQEYAEGLGLQAANLALQGASGVMVVPTRSGGYGSVKLDDITGADGKMVVRRVPLSNLDYQTLLRHRLLPEDLEFQSPLFEALLSLVGRNEAALTTLNNATQLAAQHSRVLESR